MTTSVLPRDWSAVRLGDIATVSRGASPRPIALPRWFSDSSDVGWVRIADLGRSDGLTLRVTTQRLSTDGIARSRYLQPGTLIMSIAATVGLPIVTGIPACIHDGFVSLERLHGVDQKYLLYALKFMEGELRSAGQTGSQSNVNTAIVNGLRFNLPPMDEQVEIASALSDIDGLIIRLEELITKKQAIKQGMMQELLTGKTRLSGFTERWSETRLRDVLSLQVGFPFRSQFFSESPLGVRLVRNRDLKSDKSPIYYTGDFHQAFVVQPGDVLVGMDGDFTPYIWTSGTALLNQRIGRINATQCDAKFMYFALLVPLADVESGTSATTVKHLSHKDVESLVMDLPTINEQQAIAAALADADAEIAGLRKRFRKARSIKQGMMQQLLSGRTRLHMEETS